MCRISIARLASTSLVFMLCETPAPAWKGSTRKLSISVCCRAAAFVSRRVERQAEDLVRGLDDRRGDVRLQPAGLAVGPRGGLLDLHRGPHECDVRPSAADREVVDGALGLDAEVGVRRNLEGAQRILFSSCFGHLQSVGRPTGWPRSPLRGRGAGNRKGQRHGIPPASLAVRHSRPYASAGA